MSKPSELKRLGPEDLQGAPDWFLEQFLPFQNSFNEDVYNRLAGDIGFENLTEALRDVKLTHAVAKTIKSPLADKRIRAAGVEVVKTDGLPAKIYWRNVGEDQIEVTAYYDNSGESTGYAGEMLGPASRDRGNALPLTTNTPADIGNGTTSITLTPGKWRLSGRVGFLPAATTSITTLVAAVSATSATLPVATNVQACPVDGEVWEQFSTPAAVPAANALTIGIPAYRVTVAPGTTRKLYLVGRAVFTVSTMTAFGYLEAVRETPYLTDYTATLTLRVMGG